MVAILHATRKKFLNFNFDIGVVRVLSDVYGCPQEDWFILNCVLPQITCSAPSEPTDIWAEKNDTFWVTFLRLQLQGIYLKKFLRD